MRLNILALGAALVLLGVPLHGALAGGPCSPCCSASEDHPCDKAGAPCTSFADVTCCDVVPAVPPPPAKRTIDLPSVQRVVPPVSESGIARARAPTGRADAGNLRLPSPHRLSVVLIL